MCEDGDVEYDMDKLKAANIPVSYTHLDVYKRQMQMYARLREEPEEASDKSDAKETADTSTSKTAG